MFKRITIPMIVLATYVVVFAAVMYDVHIADRVHNIVRWPLIGLSLPLGILSLIWCKQRRSTIVFRATLSVFLVVWWQACVALFQLIDWPVLRAGFATWGLFGTFFLGLSWAIWLVEKGTQRAAQRTGKEPAVRSRPIWNPLNLKACYYSLNWNPLSIDAWYYFRWKVSQRSSPNSGRSAKLDQSVATIASYSLSFFLIFVLLTSLQGCREIYEMPAGGGKRKQIARKVKIQKVIRKKFIVNPFSVVFFHMRNIDDIKLQLNKITKHYHKIGQGEGEGAGFAGGTRLGKVRFIRLRYNGGDWDQDYGVGADLNMLLQYEVRTDHKVAKRTEDRSIRQLKNFPIGKSPPMVYMTGQRNISVSNGEVKTLREYLLDKHGMIFCDNGGSRRFHQQFLSLMNRVMPNVRPVAIPLDDQIHRFPYAIPFLPYVAPHGGKEALGWWKDGRWVCYYHPGDINDAWCDDHAGVRPEVWEACYQLGTNVIFYAHAEYSKWLTARKKKKN